MRATILFLLSTVSILSASGCSTQPSVIATERPVFDAHCDARCTQPCDETPPRVNADPYSEDDALVALAGFRDTCELRRGLCVECLERARRAGVLR